MYEYNAPSALHHAASEATVEAAVSGAGAGAGGGRSTSLSMIPRSTNDGNNNDNDTDGHEQYHALPLQPMAVESGDVSASPAAPQPLNYGENNDGSPSAAAGAINSAGAANTEESKAQGQGQAQAQSQAPTSTGLIRLALRKPMGIVFEPMTDPHNHSQQRGVRICDLPRTGAAALSGRLQVGDELLSINDKTMSRLTFDEIMDFIIEADPEHVSLLFRRPRKEKLAGSRAADGAAAGAAAGTGADRASGNLNSNSNFAGSSSSDNKVKWVDDNNNNRNNNNAGSAAVTASAATATASASEGERRSPTGRAKKPSSYSSSRRSRDDDTTASGGTFETRETLETMETRETREARKIKKRASGKPRSSDRDRRDKHKHKDRDKHKHKHKDRDMYGESFLDMLIDSLCAPLVAGDKRGGIGRSDTDDFYSDDEYDDRTFDSQSQYDDDTFVTYDSGSVTEVTKETLESRRKSKGRIPATNERIDTTGTSSRKRMDGHNNNDGSMYEEDEATFESGEQDRHNLNKKASRDESKLSRKSAASSKKADFFKSNVNGTTNVADAADAAPFALGGAYEDDATLETVDSAERAANAAAAAAVSTPLGLAPIVESKNPPPSMGVNQNSKLSKTGEELVGLDADANLPISELMYDDRIDHGADVSVMESLGGPSLLIENQRNQAPGSSGIDGAAGRMKSPPKIVSKDLVQAYGQGYSGNEDAILSNPDKFYRHIVQNLLEANEPEKVRLLDKLLAKYEGREEHLIAKLAVRYEKAAGAETNKSPRKRFEEGGRCDGVTGAADKGFETFGNSFPGLPLSADIDGEGMASAESDKERSWDALSMDKKVVKENEGQDQNDGIVSDVSGSKRSDVTESDDGSYSSGTEYSGISIDGTSPAVIAQVSELLNYVYGKTSVPGQIDRVSTIMRAYEGREAVLLELLETKALIKANSESGDGALSDLPESLRNSPSLAVNQHANGTAGPSMERKSSQPDSPMSGLTMNSPTNVSGDKDEMASFNAVGKNNAHPTDDTKGEMEARIAVAKSATSEDSYSPASTVSRSGSSHFAGSVATSSTPNAGLVSNLAESDKNAGSLPEINEEKKKNKKKKSGIFGKVFGTKKSKKDKGGGDSGRFPGNEGTPKKSKSKLLSPKGNKKGVLLSRVESSEGSI